VPKSGATRVTETINDLRSVDEPLANDLVRMGWLEARRST
jgi:hypothetical protein